jgi:hypothetical protein
VKSIQEMPVPPYRDSNVSGPHFRVPAMILALCGCGVAAYLAYCQIADVSSVWDPFFGDGSRRIIDSGLSRSLPVPDALVGAIGYLIEATLEALGGGQRWRKQPELVLALGAIATAFVLGSAALVAYQALHTWCTLCLASAGISAVVFILSLPEVLATLQHVRHQLSEGHRFPQVLFGR